MNKKIPFLQFWKLKSMLIHTLGFPGGSDGKESGLQCRRPGFDPLVGKLPWRWERLPTLVFWTGELHGLYRPWGHRVRYE